jgi:hypothetical protein
MYLLGRNSGEFLFDGGLRGLAPAVAVPSELMVFNEFCPMSLPILI